MNRGLIQSICAALVVAAFVVGLPMQGTAMVSAATASPAPWSAGADVPMTGGCNWCVDQPAAGIPCPIVFCIGLSAIIVADLHSARLMSDTPPIWLEETSLGLSSAPDPYPPRTPVQA